MDPLYLNALVATSILVILGAIATFYYRKHRHVNLTGRHALVVGGSVGIGRSVAEILVRMGADVTISARDIVKLETAAAALNSMRCHPNQQVRTLVMDVASGAESVQRALKTASEQSGPIYVLVNCAGTAVCGRLEDMREADVLHLTNLNFLGSLWLARALLPLMKAAGEGHIVFVSSQAALLGIYGYSAYGATKWAVRGLAEALMMETVDTGVKVTVCFPPDTDTPGFEVEEASKPIETKLISGSGGMFSPDSVAKKLVYDALNGRPYSTVGFEGSLLLTMCGTTSSGLIDTVVQSVLMGPIRLTMMAYESHFHSIIRKCKKDKNTNKKAN